MMDRGRKRWRRGEREGSRRLKDDGWRKRLRKGEGGKERAEVQNQAFMLTRGHTLMRQASILIPQ